LIGVGWFYLGGRVCEKRELPPEVAIRVDSQAKVLVKAGILKIIEEKDKD
jgi:hypothetical protein